MADNVIRFPERARPTADRTEPRHDAEDTITFERDSLRPLATAHPGLPRPTSAVEHLPWTELVTRDYDGRG